MWWSPAAAEWFEARRAEDNIPFRFDQAGRRLAANFDPGAIGWRVEWSEASVGS